jgi:hypothetical protein
VDDKGENCIGSSGANAALTVEDIDDKEKLKLLLYYLFIGNADRNSGACCRHCHQIK